MKTVFVSGTAGSGKSLLSSKLQSYYSKNGSFAAILNLDPGVESMPYTCDVDVRDYVDYVSIMQQYELGPNGAMVMANDLIASKIDDVIDFMDGIAARVYSYKITTPPPYTVEIANKLVEATKEVEYMTSKLQRIKNPKDMIQHCKNTSDIEHVVDDLYREAIKELFESNDAIKIIKLKDIYETMETASDRCVDVADVIEDIVLKYT